MNYPRSSRQSGFTLIELLVVMGILAILLAVVLIAINPAKNFSDANNTQRRSDVSAILNAVHSYMADPSNKGQVPGGITTTSKDITSTTGASNVDLCSALVPAYIADLPLDPKNGTESPAGSICTAVGATYDSKYSISATANNRVTVTAPDTEGGVTTISVTR